MKMSEEMAVRLHRMMWSDMQRELGDRPSGSDRLKFKREWVERNFPGEHIANDCWLCEYASSVANRKGGDPYCMYCPIKWPNCHCNTIDFSYAKNPISEILAVPAKNVANDYEHVAYSYYKSREYLLSKASGIPASSAIEDHVKAIVKKAVEGKDRQLKSDCDMMTLVYCNAKKKLSEASGLEDICTTEEHIKKIQEKAVEEYFDKTPGAKLATMDVDDAFKQYADEQKAPIFRALAEASGLSSGNESVNAHISRIKEIIRQSGRLERSEEIFKALAVYSGVSEGNWSVYDHVQAIMDKASNEKDLNEIEIRKKLKDAIDALKLYQSTLSYESNLPSSAPIADHIKQIREYAFSDGQDSERERIMDKIGEMLNK